MKKYRMNSLYFLAIEDNMRAFIEETFKNAPGKSVDRPHAVLAYMPWNDDPELEDLFCSVNQRKQIMSSRVLMSDKVSGIEFLVNGIGSRTKRVRVACKVADGIRPMEIQSVQDGWREVNPEERMITGAWVRKQDYSKRAKSN